MATTLTPLDTPVKDSQEDLVAAEKKLGALLEKRADLQKQLNNIENSLYNLETSYIEEVTYGNIIRGYEGYLTARTPSGRRQRPMEGDRIFSNSSTTYQRGTEREITPGYESPDPIDPDGDYTFSEKLNRKKKEPSSTSRKKRAAHSDED